MWPALSICRRQKSARGLREVLLQDYDPAKVAAITGVSSEVIVRLAHEFAQMRPALAVPPGARPGRQDNGFLEAAAQALNALSGVIDRAGGSVGKPRTAAGGLGANQTATG